MPVTRLYARSEDAEAAVAALDREGFEPAHVRVVRPAEAAEVEESLHRAGISGANAKLYAEHLAKGATLVTVRALFGQGVAATDILDGHSPLPLETEPEQVGIDAGDPTPFSNFLGWKVLSHDPTPLSFMLGLKVLSQDKNTDASMRSLHTLSGEPAPLSSAVHMQLLSTDAAPLSAMAKLPVLSGEAAPLSGKLGMRTLSSEAAPFSKLLNLLVLLGN